MEFPRRFFEKIVGDALEQNEFDIEVRSLGMRHDKDPDSPQQFWFESLHAFEKEWIQVKDRNDFGFDMHFTVLPRLRKAHGKKEHPLPEMPVISCVWVDLDVGDGKPYRRKIDALRRLHNMKPYPNIIVESGSGLHAYWLVELREIEKERFERLLRTLCGKLDGDSGAARATRLMRVPNTINWKEENGKYGKLAKVRYLSRTRHRFKDLETRWNINEDNPDTHREHQTATYTKLFAANLDRFHNSRHSMEATALCPFHHDKHPSFSVNLKTGLWICRAESCKAKGNVEQFCDRLQIPVPDNLRETLPFPSNKKQDRPKLSERALYGLAGDIVRAIAPQTESDPAAILVQLIVAFGNCIGSRPHFEVEATKHRANLFCLIVGRTSRARKGTSWGYVKRLFSEADRRWCEEQIFTGLSSGEGLIWTVRDREEPKHDSKKAKEDDDVVESVDKRVMVLQSEFSRVLRVQRREGNTLSSVLRNAWDCETLSIMTKNVPAKATDAHVSIIGHITQDELRRELRITDEANGYANRFLFVYVDRSKILPFGGRLDEGTMEELAHALKFARHQARKLDRIRFSKRARKLWRKIYIQLSKETPGMLGAITSRAEAQVLRLSLVYALLACSNEIKTQHLKAANAVWTYCEKSAAFVFGGMIGNPVADTILRGLRSDKKGLTRDDIRELFHHNRDKDEIDEALALLANSGLAVCHRERTGGRTAERWTVV